jgi:hypothetical protein
MLKNMDMTVELAVEADTLWKDAVKMAEKYGVDFEGDAAKGSGKYAGTIVNYTTNGKTLNISAEKVPIFITEKMVRKAIEKWVETRV